MATAEIGSDGGGGRAERLERVLLGLPAILSDPEPDSLVLKLTEAARQLTAGEFAMFAPLDQGPSPPALAGATAGRVAERPDPYRAPLLAASLRDGEALHIEDVSRWAPSEGSARPYGCFADGSRVRSYLVAPLRSHDGELLGAMLVGHRQPRAFDRRDERLLAGMCEHLGVALDNARLFSERAGVAKALQETLLPPLLPHIAGVDIAARYRATGAGNLVGGDFYDVIETGDGDWAVVLGDVSGVGPEAAALTGLARYTVRAVARQQQPAEVLRTLNDALGRQRDDDRFCTALYLRLRRRPGDMELTMASGGHPPPMVVRDDGTVEPVERIPGMLLGLFSDAGLCERRLVLAPGDALVLFTDGVTEARAPATGEQFGEDRLAEVLARSAGRTADGMARRVELAAIDFQGGTARDDVAVVVLRAVP